MDVAIIGAGIAGLACADGLRDHGHVVTLFDKARGPGGRMSTRRMATPLGEVSFDHGATHFTARGGAFRAQVEMWRAAGCAAPWPIAGRDAWVGVPGMNAPVRAMAAGHDVRWATRVTGIIREGAGWTCLSDDGDHRGFDALVIAIPAEQAATMLCLQDFPMARAAMAVESSLCWSVMAAFNGPVAALPDLIRHQGILACAVRNSAKPGRAGPEAWVLQADAAWSRRHGEAQSEAVTDALLAQLATLSGQPLPAVVAVAAHRWRYATPSGSFAQALWNPAIGLGACGDWLAHGFVELAWESGRALARQMTQAVSAPPTDRPTGPVAA